VSFDRITRDFCRGGNYPRFYNGRGQRARVSLAPIDFVRSRRCRRHAAVITLSYRPVGDHRTRQQQDRDFATRASVSGGPFAFLGRSQTRTGPRNRRVLIATNT